MIQRINVSDPPRRKIKIGYYEENEFRKVVFDVSDWREAYPNGTASIIFKRADGEVYPIVPRTDSDGNPVFVPTTTETCKVGDCEFQLQWKSGSVVGKTCNLQMCVESAIGEYGDVPTDTTDDWIAQIVAATSEIVGQAQQAQRAAETAASQAQSAAQAASQSASSANASVGNLSELQTTNKGTVVAAVNEVHGEAAAAQSAAASAASDASSANAGVNTLNGKVGDLSNLTTDAKNNLVAAVNEVDAHADAAQTAANQAASAAAQAATAASQAASSADAASGKVGDLSSLQTQSKNNVVAALNEVLQRIGSSLNLDLQMDTTNGKLYIMQEGVKVGLGATIAAESGLLFDSGFVSKVDDNGMPSENYYLHLTKEGVELSLDDFVPFVVHGDGGGGGGGLVFDSGAFEKIDEDGNASDSYYLHLKSGDEDITGFTPIEVPAEMGSGGGGAAAGGSTLILRSRMDSKTFSIMDAQTELQMLFTWSSIDNATEEPTGDGTASWYVNGTRVATTTVEQGDGSFNIRPYLTTGQANSVKLSIEDNYGVVRPYTWNVTVTAYTLTWNAPALENHGESSDYQLRLVASGVGNKTLVVKVDNTEVSRQNVATSGRTTTVTIPANNLGHGAHTITAWLEVTIDGDVISTNPLRHVGIWKRSSSVTPIVAIYDSEITMKQLATYGIRYMVYDPAYSPVNTELIVDGDTVANVSVGRDIQTWAYRATEVGQKTLSVKCGVTTASVSVTVEDLGYDIAPVTDGLVVDFDPSGHSNSESNRTSFGYKDANDTVHPLIYSDGTTQNPHGVAYLPFDWTNGGFQTDNDGVTAFVVRRGCRAWFDRSLFADNAKASGKNIELIFKATNVRDFDAEIMRCLSNNIGLQFYANTGYFRCQSTSVDMKWCEDSKAEICLSVESATGKDQPRMEMWDNGTPSRGRVYDTNTMWLQNDPDYFCIGSDEADVWVYRIRAYSAYLTDSEVRANFIADAPTPEEAINRFVRNNIYTDDGSTISIQRLVAAAPDLHVIEIRTAGFPSDKKNFIPCRVEHWLGSGGPSHHWWTDSNAGFVLQGTSSLNYIESCGNLDISMVNATMTNESGQVMSDGYAMTSNSIPVKYFNTKANTASSDNANNTVSAQIFDEFDPFEPLAKVRDPRIRDSVEGHPCAVFVTNTSDTAFRCGSDKARDVQPGETILYLAGDMNNSKLTTNVFGESDIVGTDGDGIGVFCVEFMDNGYPRCKFLEEATMLNETWDNGNGGQFEFRYPTKKAIDPSIQTPRQPTDAMKIKFIEMQNWLCRLNPDPTIANGRSLGGSIRLFNPATGLEETFMYDTPTYRGCKFRNEVANYFHIDSLVYYYVFTTIFCCVDQRSKNTFVTYEPDKNGVWKFDYRAYYDGDTMLGINNKGALTLDYGVEDTDEVVGGDGMAFNAFESVLWCLVRDYLPDYCSAEFNRLESAGLISESFLNNRWDTHQRIRPEALMTEDFRNKYDGPLVRNGTTLYYESMQNGEKYSQRHGFFHFQVPYMQSKYRSGRAKQNSLLLDAYYSATGAIEAAASVEITPYMDMYITMQCDNFGTVSVRAKKGVPTRVTVSGNGGSAPAGDTATQIYNCQWITSFDSLAQFYTQQFAGTLTKLRYLPLGSSVSGYQNRNLTTLGSTDLPMLEYLNLGGLVNLETNIDLSRCPFLEEVYANGAGITGITLARGAAIEILQLPAVSRLIALDLQKLLPANFTLDMSNLSLLHVENSPGVNTQSIVQNATELAYGRLIGVNWNMDNPDPVMALIGKTGLNEESEAEGTFVLTGAVTFAAISQNEYNRLHAAFPNLTINYTSLLSEHTVRFYNWDGTPLWEESVRHGGTAPNPIVTGDIQTPTRPASGQYEYVYRYWSESLDNVVEDLDVYADYLAQERTLTVRWHDAAGGVMTQYTKTCRYGQGVTYTGPDMPDRGSGANKEYWMGWDKPTTNVTEDLDVYPQYVLPTTPLGKPLTYDYAYSDDPNDISAYTLAEFWGALKSDNPAAYLAEHDKIKIVMPASKPNSNITDTTIELKVAGFNRFKLSDGSGNFAKTVFVMCNCLNATRAMNGSNTNAGGWPATAMRSFLNNSLIKDFPIQWRRMIQQVEVLSTAGASSTEIVKSNDYLFLPSYTEVGFGTTDPYINEIDSAVYGSDMTYAKWPVFTDNASRIKRIGGSNGTATIWWLRSPIAEAGTFWYMLTSGSRDNGNYYTSNSVRGVAFGFCI